MSIFDDSVKCPYCEHERPLEWHDHEGLEGVFELECRKCEKVFDLEIGTNTYYDCASFARPEEIESESLEGGEG